MKNIPNFKILEGTTADLKAGTPTEVETGPGKQLRNKTDADMKVGSYDITQMPSAQENKHEVFEKITVGNKTYKLIKEGENTDLNLGMTTTQEKEARKKKEKEEAEAEAKKKQAEKDAGVVKGKPTI